MFQAITFIEDRRSMAARGFIIWECTTLGEKCHAATFQETIWAIILLILGIKLKEFLINLYKIK